MIADAVSAGIYNDLGSGGSVNIRVIRKDGTSDFYPYYRRENDISVVRQQYERPQCVNIPPGATGMCSPLPVIASHPLREDHLLEQLILYCCVFCTKRRKEKTNENALETTVDDLDEVGLEGSTTDEEAINVLLLNELVAVGGRDGT